MFRLNDQETIEGARKMVEISAKSRVGADRLELIEELKRCGLNLKEIRELATSVTISMDPNLRPIFHIPVLDRIVHVTNVEAKKLLNPDDQTLYNWKLQCGEVINFASPGSLTYECYKTVAEANVVEAIMANKPISMEPFNVDDLF